MEIIRNKDGAIINYYGEEIDAYDLDNFLWWNDLYLELYDQLYVVDTFNNTVNYIVGFDYRYSLEDLTDKLKNDGKLVIYEIDILDYEYLNEDIEDDYSLIKDIIIDKLETGVTNEKA